MSNRELVKPYESESADLSSNIRIFDKLVTNIRRQTPVCQTQTRISGYSSNSNPGFGGRIFDLPFTGSGIDGKIGAAAYNASSKEINHQHLGDETQYNVYVAELSALHMAVTQ